MARAYSKRRPRGGRIVRDGYEYVHVGRGHRLANSTGYAPAHLVVAEEVLGRALRPEERVVRLDRHNRRNNAPEVLQVSSPEGTWPLVELARREKRC